MRVVTMTWLLACLIISTVYRSNLKAMLIQPIQRLPFSNLEELIETNIPCAVFENSTLDTTIQGKACSFYFTDDSYTTSRPMKLLFRKDFTLKVQFDSV
ncbi:hypothetical protein E2C01_069327 [Portunus trituberculatus]|uniref:Uncharacterized protein n=1 Tax=Portunus trituberculatus TaxID=210409 RepID=A0A5B7I2H2_PORTR|nr:hypothetical protein [Portunus trituberculatus]